VAHAREWVAATLDVGRDTQVNTFETTIRVLGGLLAAVHLSGGDAAYAQPAVELAMRLLAAFQTSEGAESGLPMSDVNLHSLTAAGAHWTAEVSLSEATTLAVEFRYAAAVRARG